MKNMRNSKTDFEKLAAMTDNDIDCSDIPEFTEEFLAAVKGFAEIPEIEAEPGLAVGHFRLDPELSRHSASGVQIL